MARIIVKKRGKITETSGDDYIDVSAACVVLPDSLKHLEQWERKLHTLDGYDQVYFGRDLNPVYAQVKAGTKGTIAIAAVFTYSRLEVPFAALAQKRVNYMLKRGRRWPYEFVGGRISFGIREPIREKTYDHFDVLVEDVQENSKPSKGYPYLAFVPYARIPGKEQETIEIPIPEIPIPIPVPVPGTGEGAKLRNVTGLVVRLAILEAEEATAKPVGREIGLFHTVYFETEGKRDMSDSQFAFLKKWTEVIKNDTFLYGLLKKQNAVFSFKGHTSKTDSDRNNHDLSAERAENVKRRVEGLLSGLAFHPNVDAAGETGAIQKDFPPHERHKAYLKDRWASVAVKLQLSDAEIKKTEKVRYDLSSIAMLARNGV